MAKPKQSIASLPIPKVKAMKMPMPKLGIKMPKAGPKMVKPAGMKSK